MNHPGASARGDARLHPVTASQAALLHVRVATAVATCVLLVTALWPRLAVAPQDQPVDKLIHAASFGVLTALCTVALPRSRWWAVPAFALLLGAVIEWIQMLPALGRSCEFEDWLADAVGVLVATAFLRASAPVGRGAARLLEERRRVARESLMARTVMWLHAATVAALGFMVGAPAAIFLDSWFVRKGPQPWQYGLIGGLMGAAIAVHAFAEIGVRARLRTLVAQRPCLGCGSALPAGPGAACPACARVAQPTDWAPIAPLGGDQELRACLMPILVAFAAVVVFSASVIAIMTSLRLQFDAVMRADNWYRRLPVDARILTDFAVVALAGAWGLHRCRVRLAARQEHCGESCLRCGFDLRASAPGAVLGQCPECEGGWVRVDAQGMAAAQGHAAAGGASIPAP